MLNRPNNSLKPLSDIPWWVKSILLGLLIGTFCYKLLATDLNITFDFSAFLSLVLALFSVLLAALFYFKATDSSNAFYDNTYKFTQQVSELLARIESGFGEKLTHLDHSYKGIVDRFDSIPLNPSEDTEKQIEETKEIEKEVSEDRTKIIDALLERSTIAEKDKENLKKALNERDEELLGLKQKLYSLNASLQRNHNAIPPEETDIKSVTNAFIEQVASYTRRGLDIDSAVDRINNNIPAKTAFLIKEEGYLSDSFKPTAKLAKGINHFQAQQEQMIKNLSRHIS
ncbi:hypothetical protein OAN24_03270 [Pseudodesulfovibrio sp.]|nr:hypothetical protein [Pseudodesulfovibrio sp.]